MSLTAKWPAALVLAAVALCQLASSAHGQIIPGIYPNFQATPLIDGNSSPLYKGLSGFLYGHPYDGSNTPNDGSTHFNDGMAAANVAKVPLFGCVNEICNSAIVVLGIGFSNWTKELCGDQPTASGPLYIQPGNPSCSPNGWSFINKAYGISSQLNPKVVFVDCAIIGALAQYWASNNPMPAPPSPIPAHLYTSCNNLLTSLGLSPNQVRVVLYKDADSGRPDDGPGLAPIPSSGFVDCATSYNGQPPTQTPAT